MINLNLFNRINLVMMICIGAVTLLSCQSNTETKEKSSTPVVEQEQHNIPEVKTVTVKDLAMAIDQDNVKWVDVRTPGEIAEGYIEGAIKIDYNGADFESEIKKLDPAQTYYLYCRSGNRSGKAAEYMMRNGYTKVYNVVGGFNTWLNSGMQVYKDPK